MSGDENPTPSSETASGGACGCSDRSVPGGVPASIGPEERCARCGYIIYGLPVDGRCPECGLEVQVSLNANKLSRGSAEWLGNVRDGLRAVRQALIAVILTWVITLMAQTVIAATMDVRGTGGISTVIITAAMLHTAIWTILGMVGLTGMLVPDPIERLTGISYTRVAAVALLIAAAVDCVGIGCSMLPVPLWEHAQTTLVVLVVVLGLVIHLSAITSTLFIRGLLRPAPKQPAVRPIAVLVLLLVALACALPTSTIFVCAAVGVRVTFAPTIGLSRVLLATGTILLGMASLFAYTLMIDATFSIVDQAASVAKAREHIDRSGVADGGDVTDRQR
ncbi:MAG: hypothetical protein JXO22_04765 [Phycisphaerae bacterium]|nr:hypothetical protein [Phycisphaerae bacterium]